jgi:hypothetical protein
MPIRMLNIQSFPPKPEVFKADREFVLAVAQSTEADEVEWLGTTFGSAIAAFLDIRGLEQIDQVFEAASSAFDEGRVDIEVDPSTLEAFRTSALHGVLLNYANRRPSASQQSRIRDRSQHA